MTKGSRDGKNREENWGHRIEDVAGSQSEDSS
jgi:hypothetical protein